jgi:hypothetical protein
MFILNLIRCYLRRGQTYNISTIQYKDIAQEKRRGGALGLLMGLKIDVFYFFRWMGGFAVSYLFLSLQLLWRLWKWR